MTGFLFGPGDKSVGPALPPPFQPLRALGSGGEGTAWLAQDPRLGRSVVLKRLDSEGQVGESDWLMLMANAELPQVPTVYDCLHYQGAQWLVMEYVQGMPLFELQTADSGIGPSSWYVIAVDLAGALAAIHQAGLVHGDISPGNVVIDRNGRARLIDFGQMAKVGERALRAAAPGFCAPETMVGELLSEATDCYALGALLHWGLSGTAPELIDQGDGTYQVCCASPVGPVATLPATLWHCIVEVTAPPPDRISANRLLQHLVDARYDLPEGIDGSRQTLVGCVAHYESFTRSKQRAAPGKTTANQSYPPDQQSQRYTGQPDYKRYISAMASARTLLPQKSWLVGLGLASAALMLVYVALAGHQRQAPGMVVVVDSMAITPNTPMPAQFNRVWLMQQLQAGFVVSGGEGDAQSLKVSLTCQTTFCQLIGEHQRDLDVHWHQVSMVATESAGVWSGLLQDFSRRVAAD